MNTPITDAILANDIGNSHLINDLCRNGRDMEWLLREIVEDSTIAILPFCTCPVCRAADWLKQHEPEENA